MRKINKKQTYIEILTKKQPDFYPLFSEREKVALTLRFIKENITKVKKSISEDSVFDENLNHFLTLVLLSSPTKKSDSMNALQFAPDENVREASAIIDLLSNEK